VGGVVCSADYSLILLSDDLVAPIAEGSA